MEIIQKKGSKMPPITLLSYKTQHMGASCNRPS